MYIPPEDRPSRADHPVKILLWCTVAMVVLFVAGFIIWKLGSAIYGIIFMSCGILLRRAGADRLLALAEVRRAAAHEGHFRREEVPLLRE